MLEPGERVPVSQEILSECAQAMKRFNTHDIVLVLKDGEFLNCLDRKTVLDDPEAPEELIELVREPPPAKDMTQTYLKLFWVADLKTLNGPMKIAMGIASVSGVSRT
jgi:hypothetical protein